MRSSPARTAWLVTAAILSLAFSIQFLVEGEMQIFPVRQIEALIFDRPAATSQQAAKARSAAAAEHTVTVPADTRLLVRMIDAVDPKRNKVGDRFRASLETAIVVNGKIVAPEGTEVYGRLSEARGAGCISGRAELQLELTEIVIGDQTYPLITDDCEVTIKTTTKQMDSVTVITFSGRITMGDETNQLRETIRCLVRQGNKRILLNLADVSFIDGTGLGELVASHAHVKNKGGQLKLLKLTKKVRDLLRITKFVTVFDIYDDEAEAIKSFGTGVGGDAGTGVAVATKGEQVRVCSQTSLEFRIEQPFTVRVW